MKFKPKIKGIMNDTEKWYADNILIPAKKAKIIKSWKYEPRKFILAKKTTYTPDFEYVKPNGDKVYVEIKGSWMAKGAQVTRVKIKVAAALNPEYTFIGVVIQNHKIKKEEKF